MQSDVVIKEVIPAGRSLVNGWWVVGYMYNAECGIRCGMRKIPRTHWRIYHWATWAMPPPWAVDQKCSKLKISHTAVIAARVVKQRKQRDSV